MAQYTLSTAEDIYKAVLDGIKKESTAVLTPDSFNRLINDNALIMWLREKAGDNDKDQPMVDALRNLYKLRELKPSESKEFFELPNGYYRLQSVSFKLQLEAEKESSLTDWLPTRRLRMDNVGLTMVNPFRKPTNDRLYYYQEGDKIMNYPENKNIVKARVFYLAYPDPIIFSPNAQSVNGNLTREQNKEVVDIAVRIHLERVKEERYQTVLMEKSLKLQNQNT